jgi:hypothetical protein
MVVSRLRSSIYRSRPTLPSNPHASQSHIMVDFTSVVRFFLHVIDQGPRQPKQQPISHPSCPQALIPESVCKMLAACDVLAFTSILFDFHRILAPLLRLQTLTFLEHPRPESMPDDHRTCDDCTEQDAQRCQLRLEMVPAMEQMTPSRIP